MKIKEEFKGKIPVLYLSGNLMGGEDSANLQERIKTLINDGFKNIVMDFSNIKWINSTGLGAIMACLTTARNNGGDIRLANITEKLDSLLNITKLITVFQTYKSVDRAVASFELEN